ncbi:hypothetical protein QR674_10030 [Acinetobacter chinensis]|uniref:Glycosyltransferase RgtA/B/C/D-like domain-containing protein n=1 Tax=Acinetobacter chinensis TaxID=2004650 RepID=A0ABU3WFX8_9GAMM|nr:hypothetical protein [Acinetobacter chinensis]MDV2469323.1 hypothetical protein [Acinetobacter chinensis]
MIFLKKYFFLCAVFTFSIFYLFSAWVADDAYITFRTIENFHNGYGLRWNIDERVQSYTHPLWMLNLLIGKYLIDDLYYLSLTLGYVYTIATIYILYLLCSFDLKKILLSLLILFSSKAVLDFSSSGLENSLSYFLISLFFYTIIKLKDHKYYYIILSLILSCMFLNRMDLIIPVLPFAFFTFFYQAYKNHEIKKSIYYGVVGFVPVVLWSIFSIYYYGSFFANSVIAKTNTGLPIAHLQIQGFKYLYSNILYDPFTSIFIYITTIYAIFSKKQFNKLIGLGLILYIYYLVNIGADYMYGRFLTIPYIVSLFIFINNYKTTQKITTFIITIVAALSIYNFYQFSFKKTEQFIISNKSFNDERAFYYNTTGLLPNLKNTNVGIADHFLETRYLFEAPVNQPTDLYTMGFNGYLASKLFPQKHIVDRLALTDAFLAAHPMNYGYWRIGHFERAVNQEYMDSIQQNKNLITLAQDHYVFEQVYLLTKAPLNDPRRIQAIVNWHNGTTFKVAKQGFQYYPHSLLMNHEQAYLENLWIAPSLSK